MRCSAAHLYIYLRKSAAEQKEPKTPIFPHPALSLRRSMLHLSFPFHHVTRKHFILPNNTTPRYRQNKGRRTMSQSVCKSSRTSGETEFYCEAGGADDAGGAADLLP